VNRTLPPGDCGYRNGDPRRPHRFAGALPRAIGLVSGVAHPPERATPPGRNPAARCKRRRFKSGFDGVAALAVLTFVDVTVRPIFLPTVPERKPRSECGCQDVALSNSLVVAPPGRFSISRMVAVLLPSRASFRALRGVFFFGVAFLPAFPLTDATFARRVPGVAFLVPFSRASFLLVRWSCCLLLR
jgi:hypothetical protein